MRSRLIALAATTLAAAGLLAACGGESETVTRTVTTDQLPTTAPATTAAPTTPTTTAKRAGSEFWIVASMSGWSASATVTMPTAIPSGRKTPARCRRSSRSEAQLPRPAARIIENRTPAMG